MMTGVAAVSGRISVAQTITFLASDVIGQIVKTMIDGMINETRDVMITDLMINLVITRERKKSGIKM